jgi:phosphoglycolate phosphatase
MKSLEAVIFDVDGVLLDSLAPHLRICEDKSKEYGLGLTIPNPHKFKEMVRQGVKISPMNYFFLGVGFPEDAANRAFIEYKEEFMRDYAPVPFPYVKDTLERLYNSGLVLGIVTSNFRVNVEKALGSCMKFFQSDCIFSADNMVGQSKESALISVTQKMGITCSQSIYVGDQPSDWLAAESAGLNFLGVTYGWGISIESKEFPTVNNVKRIYQYISLLRGDFTSELLRLDDAIALR